MMKVWFGRYPRTVLLALCVMYFIIQSALIVWNQPDVLNVESDNLLYDAKLVSEGVVPFKDILTRSIVPLYLYAGMFVLFGIHIKLIWLFGQGAIALAAYFLGRITYTFTGSLWAAVIAVFSYWLIGGRDIADLFLLPALWILVAWKEHTRWQLAGAIGGLVGLAVLSYQAYIVWVLVIGLLLLYTMITQLNTPHIRLTGKSLVAYFSGLFISLVLPLVWFVRITDWRWMSQLYLVDQMIYVVIGTLLVTGSLFVILQLTAQRRWFIWLIHFGAIVIVALFGLYRMDLLDSKVAALHDFARSAAWAIIPTLAVLWSGVIYVFQRQAKWLVYSVGGSILVFIELFLIGTIHPDRGPSLELSTMGKGYFVTIMVVLVIFTFRWLQSNQTISHSIIGRIALWPLAMIGVSLSAMFGASLLYGEWLPSYIHNYAIGLAMGTGVFFYWIIQSPATPQRRQLIAMLIMSLLFCSFVFPKITAHEVAFNSAVDMHTDEALAVVEYIKQNSTIHDTIFTAVPLFALRSGRDLVAPITHPVAYIKKDDAPFTYDPYHTVPSVTQLMTTLQTEQPKFVVADARTSSLFMSDRHPNINKYIRNHYTQTMKFGNIKIFERNSAPPNERLP